MRIAYLFQAININFSEPSAIQVHIYQLIRSLQNRDHDARLVALQGRQVLVTQDIESVRNNEVATGHYCNLGITGNTPYKLFESGTRRIQTDLRIPYLAWFDSHRMYDACYRNLCDFALIHERYNLLAIGGALASKRLGIPFILEVNADIIDEVKFQGNPEKGIRKLWANFTARLCFDSANKIICVSSGLKDHMVRKWSIDPNKVVVLPNAADTELFGQQYDITKIKKTFGLIDESIVMFVGGFYIWHDLSLLIKSFTKVTRTISNAKLILMGDGRTMVDIEQLIEQEGLQNHVIMTGKVDHSLVPEMLSITDVAVAPNISFFDGHGGSPLKIFEYMSAGKAIVATRTGQITDIVKDGYSGILVQPGDVDAFAEAIIMLLQHPRERRRLSQNAKQMAIEKHSWEHYAVRLEEIYRSVL